MLVSFFISTSQLLYPELLNVHPLKTFGKLTSKFLNIRSKELLINPDWDEDTIQKI